MSDYSNIPTPPPAFTSGGDGSKVGTPVTFGNALQVVFSKYANGKGRSTRSEYWFFSLWGFIIGYGGTFIAGLVGVASAELSLLASGVVFLASLVLIIPGITVTVRRLHDTNKSAHYLWFILIPIAGAIAMLVFMLQPSDPGPNNYGPQPA